MNAELYKINISKFNDAGIKLLEKMLKSDSISVYQKIGNCECFTERVNKIKPLKSDVNCYAFIKPFKYNNKIKECYIYSDYGFEIKISNIQKILKKLIEEMIFFEKTILEMCKIRIYTEDEPSTIGGWIDTNNNKIYDSEGRVIYKDFYVEKEGDVWVAIEQP